MGPILRETRGYIYVVIMLSEQLRVENDCKAVANKKMEKKHWV